MSLINKVLDELAAREQPKPELLAGVKVDPATGRRVASGGRKPLAFAGLVVLAAALGWLILRPRAPAPTPVAAAHPVVPPAEPAEPPKTAIPVGGYQMDTQLNGALESTPVPPQPPPSARLQLDESRTLDLAQPGEAARSRGSDAERTRRAQELYGLATADLAAGRLEQAEEQMVAVLDIDPAYHPAREALVALRLDQGRIADARRSLNRGLGLAPKHVPYLQLAERARAAAAASRPAEPRPAAAAPAVAAEPAGAAPEPAPQTARVELPSAPPAKPSGTAEGHHQAASTALQQGNWGDAEQHLRDALALEPDRHEAREALAGLMINQGRLDEAQALLEAGRALDPQQPGFRRLLAHIEIERGRPQQALAVLLPSPPAMASDIEYHELLAAAYQRVGRHEEASMTYRLLLQQRPDRAAWWVGYGISREALDQPAQALEAYQRGRRLGGLDPRLLDHANRRIAALQAGAPR